MSTLLERHRAAQLLSELTRPTSALVVAHLPARPGSTISSAQLQQRTSLPGKEFWSTIGRLVESGVVRRTVDGLTLDRDQLDGAVTALVADSPLTAILPRHPRLEPFCRWGRVVRAPVEPELVDELYAALAALFEPGETLTESEVNARIISIHDDPAEVRRGLVDRNLLQRTPGSARYRRP